jgi:hypothetical protein
MLQLPKPNRRFRLFIIGYGLVLFIWFTPEDNHVWPATVLGLGMAALLVIWNVLSKLGGKIVPRQYVVLGAVLLGVMVGAGTSVATAGLMFFKNALHAHLFVDYPTPLLLAVLERAPAWGLAGGLAGLGAALAWLSLKQDIHESSHDYR